MDNKVDRDVVAMKHFAAKLSDFSDQLAQKSAYLLKLCDQASHAMQDQNGKILVNRLTDMATQLQDPMNDARTLSERISRSAAILEALEKGD